MKNKERFANEIIDIALKDEKIAIIDNKPVICGEDKLQCMECWRDDGAICKALAKWAEQEYMEDPEETEIDWSKVPMDTPIYVRDGKNQEWIPRHFAKYENGTVYAFTQGHTSFTKKDDCFPFDYAKLAVPLKTPQNTSAQSKLKEDFISDVGTLLHDFVLIFDNNLPENCASGRFGKFDIINHLYLAEKEIIHYMEEHIGPFEMIQEPEGEYLKNIVSIFENQREKGLKEYGKPLEEETDMNSIQRLTAIEEELVDALMYIEHAKEGMKE